MTYQASLTLVSRNAKTGPIPVSTTSAATCPLACPLRKDDQGGCYAEGGPLAIFWRKVTSGEYGLAWSEFTKAIAKLPKGIIWRHNQAGDLPSADRVNIDAEAFRALIKANKGKRGFTYTHFNVTQIKANADLIKEANASGFRVNLSANSLAHADALADTDCGPVVTILPASVHGNVKLSTPKGRKVTVCPATYREDVTCASCGLCARLRDVIIGFPAHGAQKKKADIVANATSAIAS